MECVNLRLHAIEHVENITGPFRFGCNNERMCNESVGYDLPDVMQAYF